MRRLVAKQTSVRPPKTFRPRWAAVAVAAAILGWTSGARAETVAWDSPPGNGGPVGSLQGGSSLDGADAYDLSIQSDQLCGPTHILLSLPTDSPNDPTIKSINDVINDTGAAWGAYEVELILDAGSALTPNYSISAPTVTSPDNDWTATITQPLAYVGINSGGQYVYQGSLLYAAGTPVASGEELDFSYIFTFAGSPSYTAIQEQTPLPVNDSVPEPSSVALFDIGAMVFLAYACLRRRPRGGVAE